MTTTDPDRLAHDWAALTAAEPHLRIREAASRLAVAEAQLLATRCGTHATRLTGSWPDLLNLLHDQPPAMALTRNASCVLELNGQYPRVETFGPVGQGVGTPIDLRYFFNHWAKGFALSEEVDGKLRHSLQFFDAQGDAVHKVYFLDGEALPRAEFERLIAPHVALDQGRSEAVEPAASEAVEPPDASQQQAFLAAWASMESPHDYAGLLRGFGLSRLQALAWAEGTYAQRQPTTTVRAVLEAARDSQVPIMIFVGNKGCLQIYSGVVTHLAARGPWFNVLDPQVNLHLLEPEIAACWLVRRPLGSDFVHAVEAYRADGLHILTLYGQRKAQDAELPQWRALLDGINGLRALA
jgi:putative hemin transport protein